MTSTSPGISLALFVSFAFWVCGWWRISADDRAALKPRGRVVLTDAARKLHAEALVIDGHNDLPFRYRMKNDLALKQHDLRQRLKDFHTDIPRLREGGVGAQFWSAFVPSTSTKTGSAVRETLEQIDFIHRLVAAYPDVFALAGTADDIVRIRSAGKIASLIGVEGGHSIDNSLGVLRTYYALGVRYLTLTHTENVDWADSATDQPRLRGLSPFGEEVVREMNRIGMLVDISHIAPDVMKHVLRITRAPVIASHSSAYALAAHPRNVPDDVLRLIRENGGVVMVNFYSGFVVPEGARATQQLFRIGRELRQRYPNDAEFHTAMSQWLRENPFPRGTIHHVVDHIEHIVKVAGIDHVGLGSDFDGISTVPEQLDDVACFPLITQELLNRGYDRQAILAILGGNVLRVLRQAEAVARSGG